MEGQLIILRTRDRKSAYAERASAKIISLFSRKTTWQVEKPILKF